MIIGIKRGPGIDYPLFRDMDHLVQFAKTDPKLIESVKEVWEVENPLDENIADFLSAFIDETVIYFHDEQYYLQTIEFWQNA